MGQYFRFISLNSRKKNYPNKDKVKGYIIPWDYDNGAKMMEFSYLKNSYVNAFEELINKEHGEWAGQPVVLAGDYGDEEPYTYNKEKVNLYFLSDEFKDRKHNYVEGKHYRYIINEDKKQFFDTEKVKPNKDGWRIHPLPLLIADNVGRGGGDYGGVNEHRVGIWKCNIVVTSDNKPDDTYKEIFINWIEEW